MTDTLAARLRAAYHADMPGEAVPFDELKPCVCDRWQRVADAAALRVPFSDETIERMAKAAQPIVYEGTKWHIMHEAAKMALRQGIRAALAAGGLESCADPADVALAPADDAWKAPLEFRDPDDEHVELCVDDRYGALLYVVAKRIYLTPADAARMAAWLSSYAAAHGVVTYKRNPANSYFEGDPKPADEALRPKIRIAQTARMMEFRWLEICRKHGPENDVDGCPWLKDALCDFANYIIAHAIIDATQDAMDSTPIIADLHKQLEAARREVDEVRRHISVTMSREHQARKEAQEAKRELAALHPGETVEGVIMERDHYRIQLQHESEWVRQYKQDRDDALAALRERAAVPVKVRWDVTWRQVREAWMSKPECGPEAWYTSVMDYLAAHAVIDVPAGVPSVPELVKIGTAAAVKALGPNGKCIREARAIAIRDAVLGGVGQPSSNTGQLDEVEALARVLQGTWTKSRGLKVRWEDYDDSYQDGYLAEACAAIAHLRKRPEGLPTPDQFNTHFARIDRGLFEHDVIELIYNYLTPWLRDPVGWELDVTYAEVCKCWGDQYSHPEGLQAVLDLCRSRIRPVMECKECAEKDARIGGLLGTIRAYEQVARAALEGE